MTERKDKLYPHVTGILGDDGENPGVLAISAVLDPNPHYPEDGRIIVGSPKESKEIPGYLPDLGGFAMGIAGAERLIATLQLAISDIRAATGKTVTGEVWEYPPYLVGFHRIGRMDSGHRRSLWLKEEDSAFELRAGVEGGDVHVRVTSRNPQFADLADAMGRARFAAEWEDTSGSALVPMGIERHGYEDSSDALENENQRSRLTTVYLFSVEDASRWETPRRFRVLVRHGRHFAVQVATSGAADVTAGGPATYWDSVTQAATGISPDQVMAMLLVELARRGVKNHIRPLQPVVSGGVTTLDLGDIWP